jgi:hypothetical protein
LSYVISQRIGRFLGDTEQMQFHDLLYEVEGDEGCGIDSVLREGNSVGFFPDRAAQAKQEGFKPCPKCIG